jgi:8-oxo-dGTP pyrophosphatase MutT (NUDIX family)
MHKKVQVTILAKNPRPSVLLLKLSEKRGAFWQNVTGSVDEGEDFDQAAPRELWEETGIEPSDAEVTPLHFSFEFHDRFGRDIKEACYLAVVDDLKYPIKISDEHQKYVWKEIDLVTPEDYGHPSSFEVFQKAVEVFNA